MSWYSFRPYVSVAERRHQAEQTARAMAKKGRKLSPVHLPGRVIASTFWGKSWCENLESYSDYANRLPRGRTYVRNGSVIDLQIASGKVTALVQGSSLYRVSVAITPLPKKAWRAFTDRCAGKVTNLLDLLQGRLSKDILEQITAHGLGLFPSPKEIDLDCSCPDWADMCKHVAAVLYGVGARLDEQPELFFTLRGVAMDDLIRQATVTASAPVAVGPRPDSALAGANLAEIFGVELEAGTPATPPPKKTTPPAKPKPARPQPGKHRGPQKRPATRKVSPAPTSPAIRKTGKPRRTRQ